MNRRHFLRISMVPGIAMSMAATKDALEETGQRENTIVIFTSDHGDMTGDHGLVGKGCRFYDPLVRVPLIFSWPGRFRAGLRSQAIVELTDIVPTLLEVNDLYFNANPATMMRLMADFGASSLRELLSKLNVDIVDIRGVVDPIQVSAAKMDPAQIKSQYDSRICLHGSIDTQYILPQGSPQQVAENTRRMINILGRDGGFILAPCHVLQTDVPSENIRSMYETGQKCGIYNTR